MKLALILIGGLYSLTASAGVFKCTDEAGKVVYRSGPCSNGQSNIQINLKSGTSTDLQQERAQQKLKDQEAEAAKSAEEQEAAKLAEKKARIKQEAKDEMAKTQFLIKNNRLKYSIFAIPPYDPDNLPALVRVYQDRLPEIERFRRSASEKALATNACGRVEAVELNIKSTKEALVFLVDCSTAKKYYFTEQELKPQ